MLERKYSADQERDERGRWSSGGGGGGPELPGSKEARDAVGTVPKDHPGNPKGTGTLEDPKYVDSDLDLAARELYAGNHVRLDQKDQVSTLVDKMGDMAQDAVNRGESAPTYDLGKVTVPGTNLFTQESLGIPRVEMPQLSGVAAPGSPAAQMAGAGNKINLGDHFRDTLEQQGYKVTDERVPAENLRATQMDLVGPQVAGMSRALDAGKLNIRPIFVSKDNYVVDGHHQWAATTLSNIRAGQDKFDMPVQRVNADIGTILDTARAYTSAMGIQQKAGVKLQATVAALNRMLKHLERKMGVVETSEVELPASEWTYDSPGSTFGDWDTWLRVTRRKVREMRAD